MKMTQRETLQSNSTTTGSSSSEEGVLPFHVEVSNLPSHLNTEEKISTAVGDQVESFRTSIKSLFVMDDESFSKQRRRGPVMDANWWFWNILLALLPAVILVLVCEYHQEEMDNYFRQQKEREKSRILGHDNHDTDHIQQQLMRNDEFVSNNVTNNAVTDQTLTQKNNNDIDVSALLQRIEILEQKLSDNRMHNNHQRNRINNNNQSGIQKRKDEKLAAYYLKEQQQQQQQPQQNQTTMTMIQESITNFFTQQLDINNKEEEKENNQDSKNGQSIESTSSQKNVSNPLSLLDVTRPSKLSDPTSKTITQSRTLPENHMNQHSKNVLTDINDVSSNKNENDTSVLTSNENNRWNQWIGKLLWNRNSPTMTSDTQQNMNNTKKENES